MPDRHTPRPNPRVLLDGISFGESPRWHDGRLWFCDWAAEELIAIDPGGRYELITNVRSFPFSIDWLPDGRLLIVSARDKALLTLQPDGTLGTYADLSGLGPHPPNNEIVIDARGHVFVDGGGFDLMAGEPPAPGTIAVITPDGTARQVADGIAFGNGMAITEDGSTLIVAESYGHCLTGFTIAADGSLSDRRTWAELGEGAAPDGICLDAEGAVWYADVPNRRCVRVREGGDVLETVPHDRGCFACMLGGEDGTTLFIVARKWEGVASTRDGERTGQLLTVGVDVPHAGRP
jgi:sugar lactone lactonase YvrE